MREIKQGATVFLSVSALSTSRKWSRYAAFALRRVKQWMLRAAPAFTFPHVFSGDEWQAQHEEDHQNSLQSGKEI